MHPVYSFFTTIIFHCWRSFRFIQFTLNSLMRGNEQQQQQWYTIFEKRDEQIKIKYKTHTNHLFILEFLYTYAQFVYFISVFILSIPSNELNRKQSLSFIFQIHSFFIDLLSSKETDFVHLLHYIKYQFLHKIYDWSIFRSHFLLSHNILLSFSIHSVFCP